MRHSPLHGAGYFLRGLGLIFKPGLRRFVAVPLLINVTVFALLIYFGAGQISALLDWALPSWLEWLRWLAWPLFALAAALVVFFSFSLLGNLIAGPFNGFPRRGGGTQTRWPRSTAGARLVENRR